MIFVKVKNIVLILIDRFEETLYTLLPCIQVPLPISTCAYIWVVSIGAYISSIEVIEATFSIKLQLLSLRHV